MDVRVLLVDDEKSFATMVAAGLTAEGFDVDIAHDGNDAFWLLDEHPYAAVVLDLLLPGISGFEVCREVRSKGSTTPILVLTAKNGELDEAEALDTGADDFLSKPFSLVVLVARLRALLRRGERPLVGTVRTAGTLILDPIARTCQRGSTDIDLTRREFAVLRTLVDHQGEVVSKTHLLNEVWGPEAPVDVNVVEVYIRYLRTKIDRPFGLDTIRTVRGTGYRLIADA